MPTIRDALALVTLSLFVGTAVDAENYLLTPGDELMMSLSASDEPRLARIGPDGTVRVRSAGGVPVAGMTLDAAEAAIEAAVAASGIFVAPDVDIAVGSYAPILITGDVATPGRYDYLPQLTVESAAGLSGGISKVRGAERLDVARAQNQIDGELLTLRLDIMATVARIARLEAEIDETTDTVVPSEALRQSVPVTDDAALATMVADQQAILDNSRARKIELVQGWNEEIEGLLRQQELLQERMQLQDQIVESLQAELSNAQSLADRGLATTNSLNRAEQLAGDAQARTLELEAALTGIERGISAAKRGRDGFLRNSTEEALLALRASREQLNELRVRYGTAESQSLLLADGNLSTLLDEGVFEVDYTLIDGRTGEARRDVAATTALQPGDTVQVQVSRDTPEG